MRIREAPMAGRGSCRAAEEGERIGAKRVARLMEAEGVEGISRRKYVVNTHSGPQNGALVGRFGGLQSHLGGGGR